MTNFAQIYKKMAKIKSVQEAVQMIEVCAIKEGEATKKGDYKTNNKYARYEKKCLLYLYEHNQLQALHGFLKHENHRVRLSTAYALLPLYEEECIEVLSEIAYGDYGLSSLSAEMILKQWADGKLKFPYQADWGKETSPKKEEKSSVVTDTHVEHMKSEDFSPEIFRLSRLFECPPTSDTEIRNEECGFYIRLSQVTKEITIRVNTFVNPYTQEVETVYQERLKRFKKFEIVATIDANKPSKLGFMQIALTIANDKATDDVLAQIKEVIYATFNEWKPNESLVWFKAECHGAFCYFEGEWWMPTRAVIKNGDKYERYDFSDEMKFDEQMWEIVQGEYDELEYSDTFALIGRDAFQLIWENTECVHIPEPW